MTGTASISDRRFRKWSGTPLEEQRGVIRCGHCGRKYEGNFAEASKNFKEHLRKRHPKIQPRPRAKILADYGKKEKEEKRRKNKALEEAQAATSKAAPIVSRPKKESAPRRELIQPELTEEMVKRAQALYGEVGSLQRLADQLYVDFGFSSAKGLKANLSRAFRERGIPLRASGSESPLTEEMFNEARRLCEKERMSVWNIAGQKHRAWGYSFNGLRNTLYRLFRERGIDYHQIPRKKGVKRAGTRNRITPERLEVIWHLHSAGNYHLQEITEMASGVWGHLGHSTLGQSLKRGGYKVRAGRWGNDGSRPIKKRDALKLVKSVK